MRAALPSFSHPYRRSFIVPWCVAVAALVSTSTARAQCQSDVDCKGDRICVAGQCQDPIAQSGIAPRSRGRDHWARGAGVFGIIASIGTLGLALGSEVTKGEDVPSLYPLGVAATALCAASVPIIAAGAASARRASGGMGAPPLKVAAWVGYGMSLVSAVVLINIGLSETPADGLIVGTGALGAAASLLMTLDAFSSANEADRLAVSAAPVSDAGALVIVPVGGVTRDNEGHMTGRLGLAAVF